MSMKNIPNLSQREFIYLSVLKDSEGPLWPMEVVRRSKGDIPKGATYTILYRMEEKGLVNSWRQVFENGDIKRWCNITKLGNLAVKKYNDKVVKYLKQGHGDYMPKAVKEIFEKIDWNLLKDQKLDILNFQAGVSVNKKRLLDSLSGIIHLIDAIQDAAVDSGMFPEHEVFPSRKEEEGEA